MRSSEDIRKDSRDDTELAIDLGAAVRIVWSNQDLGDTTKQNIADDLRAEAWEL